MKNVQSMRKWCKTNIGGAIANKNASADFCATPSSLTDPRERKKIQNIVASRKYMAKKKAQMKVDEMEEQALILMNNELKSQLNSLEVKIDTIKKLMHNTGIMLQKNK